MVKTVNMRVFNGLIPVFETIRKDVAKDMKKKYNLNEVIIPSTLASQIAAAKLRGDKRIKFKIEKCGLNKGILKLL